MGACYDNLVYIHRYLAPEKIHADLQLVWRPSISAGGLKQQAIGHTAKASKWEDKPNPPVCTMPPRQNPHRSEQQTHGSVSQCGGVGGAEPRAQMEDTGCIFMYFFSKTSHRDGNSWNECPDKESVWGINRV